MGKKFKVKGNLGKHIHNIYSYWYYYDRGYHGISLYVTIDGRRHYCDSQSNYDKAMVDSKEYEFEIEHHDYDYITKAHKALIKEAKERMKNMKGKKQ